MNRIIRVYEQQAWHPKANVEIREGAEVTIDGTPLTTEREQALAWIILRLNAYVVVHEREAAEEKAKVK